MCLAACIALLCPVLPSCVKTAEEYGEGYFFDSSAADGGDGSYSHPFNNISAAESLDIAAGESLYLKRGSNFAGSLRLIGLAGTEEEPITVTAYGEGEDPKIDGDGLEGSGVVYIENCSNLIVENLDIFDSVTTEGDRRGILLDATNPDNEDDGEAGEIITYSNITIRNCYIHDIKGYLDAINNGMDWASKMTGGIQFWSTDGGGRYDGLTITGCEIYNADNVGISSNRSNGSSNPYDEDFADHAYLNVEISHNEIHNIGKNAIFVRNLYGGVIEYNVVHDTSVRCYTGNSIVTRNVDGTVIQYNEGYNNMARKNDMPGSNKGLMDGCMLDADLQSRNTIWQYNYSHDNSFGLFLNCTGSSGSDKDSKDVAIVRYNLSVCDKGNKGVIYINYYSSGIEVYNNTIITGADTKYIFQANDSRAYHFYNNVVCNFSADARFDMGDMKLGSADHNLVYSVDGASIKNLEQILDSNTSLTLNPKLENVIGGTLESRIGMENALLFCSLLPDSHALDGRYAVPVEGIEYDFCGNEYRPSLGCYCG